MNKELITAVRLNNVPLVPHLESLVTLHENFNDKKPAKSLEKGSSDQARIHGLYQDLYLTDLKSEIDDVDYELSVANQQNLVQE